MKTERVRQSLTNEQIQQWCQQLIRQQQTPSIIVPSSDLFCSNKICSIYKKRESLWKPIEGVCSFKQSENQPTQESSLLPMEVGHRQRYCRFSYFKPQTSVVHRDSYFSRCIHK